MSHDNATCPNYRDAITLIESRATTNRIRMSAQQEITHVIEILDVLNDVSDPEDWIAAARASLRHIIRDLDKLPKN